MDYKIKRPGKAKNAALKMAAKLIEFSGFYHGNKARDYSIARRATKYFYAEVEHNQAG